MLSVSLRTGNITESIARRSRREGPRGTWHRLRGERVDFFSFKFVTRYFSRFYSVVNYCCYLLLSFIFCNYYINIKYIFFLLQSSNIIMSPVILVPLRSLVHIKPVVDKQFFSSLQVLQCLYCWYFSIARMLNSW